jgi:hypothetical protein
MSSLTAIFTNLYEKLAKRQMLCKIVPPGAPLVFTLHLLGILIFFTHNDKRKKISPFFSYVIRFEIYLFRRDLGNHHPRWPADHQQHTYISRLSKDQRRHAHAYIALSTHALDLVQLMLLIYITYAAKHTVWTPSHSLVRSQIYGRVGNDYGVMNGVWILLTHGRVIKLHRRTTKDMNKKKKIIQRIHTFRVCSRIYPAVTNVLSPAAPTTIMTIVSCGPVDVYTLWSSSKILWNSWPFPWS